MVMLLVVGGVLLAILTVLMIYRSTLEMHEDDQLFLDAAESHMAKEQEEIRTKLAKIEPAIKVIGGVTALIFLAAGGMWIKDALEKSNNLR